MPRGGPRKVGMAPVQHLRAARTEIGCLRGYRRRLSPTCAPGKCASCGVRHRCSCSTRSPNSSWRCRRRPTGTLRPDTPSVAPRFPRPPTASRRRASGPSPSRPRLPFLRRGVVAVRQRGRSSPATRRPREVVGHFEDGRNLSLPSTVRRLGCRRHSFVPPCIREKLRLVRFCTSSVLLRSLECPC